MADDLRQRYITLLSTRLPCLTCGHTKACRCTRPKDSPSNAERRADLLLTERDDELEQLRAEVSRLRAGESEPPAAEGHYPTPAEWIHRWNRSTPEQRLDRAAWILADAAAVRRCQMEDHGAAVAIEGYAMRARALHPSPAELVAVHAESDSLCPTCIHPAPCPTRRALDGEDS